MRYIMDFVYILKDLLRLYNFRSENNKSLMVVIDNLYTAILGIKNQNYKTPPADEDIKSFLTLISDIKEHKPNCL